YPSPTKLAVAFEIKTAIYTIIGNAFYQFFSRKLNRLFVAIFGCLPHGMLERSCCLFWHKEFYQPVFWSCCMKGHFCRIVIRDAVGQACVRTFLFHYFQQSVSVYL